MGMLKKLGKALNGQEQKQEEDFVQVAAKKLLKALLKLLRRLITTKLFIILLPVIIALFLIVLIWNGMLNISIQSSSNAASSIKGGTSFVDGAITLEDDLLEQIRDQLRLDGIDPNAIYLGPEHDYLEKIVQATVVTNYPDTGVGDIRGAVKIHRQDKDGTKRALIYTDEASFETMLNNATTADAVTEVMNYFTVDSDINIIIAKYNKETTIDGAGTTTVTYNAEKVTLSYINQVSQYAMPFEFLYVLMVTTLNPEYVAAVADLALTQTVIEYTIMDSVYIGKTITDHNYDLTTRTIVTESGAITSNSDSTTHHNIVTTAINEINTITAAITKVETWAYKKSSTYTNSHRPETKVGETTITKDLAPDDERYQDQEISNNSVTDSNDPNKITRTVVTKHDIYDVIEEYMEEWIWTSTPEPSDEPEVNYHLFLGLWQNDTGEYEEGARYNPEGKVVTYFIPATGFSKSPAVTICNSPEIFFYQLGASENTQSYENLMRYIIYIYTGQSYGVTEDNVDEILNMFRGNLVPVGRGGSIIVDTSQSVPELVLTKEQLRTAIEAKYSGQRQANLLGALDAIYEAQQIYNVNGVFTIAVTIIESGAGTVWNGIAPNTYNWCSVSGSYNGNSYTKPGSTRRWRSYSSFSEATLDFGNVIANSYFKVGKYDVKSISDPYCVPPGPWAQSVTAEMIALYDKLGITVSGSISDVPSYYQNDYAHISYGNSNLAKAGCGPTAFAMVATAFGVDVDPPAAIAWCGNRYYVSGKGTSWAYFAAAVSHFNVPCSVRQVGTGSYNEVEAALQRGAVVISSQGPGLFTRGGHFIVLAGIDENNNIYVNDPNKNNAVNKGYDNRAFTRSEITQAAKQYWIFE